MPFPRSLVVKNGSNSRASTSGPMPMPVSLSIRRTCGPFADPGCAATKASFSTTLSVVIRSVPPDGIASRALTARFMMTCSIWPGSALMRRTRSPRAGIKVMSSPITRPSMVCMPPTRVFRSRTCGSRICWRLKASSCRVNNAALRPALTISWTSSRICPSGGSSARVISPKPRIAVNRLLKSWAIPLASRPIPSIFCAWRTCASSVFRSVTSSAMPASRYTSPASL